MTDGEKITELNDIIDYGCVYRDCSICFLNTEKYGYCDFFNKDRLRIAEKVRDEIIKKTKEV